MRTSANGIRLVLVVGRMTAELQLQRLIFGMTFPIQTLGQKDSPHRGNLQPTVPFMNACRSIAVVPARAAHNHLGDK